MLAVELAYDLGAMRENARRIMAAAHPREVRVFAVVKGVCADPDVAKVLVEEGVDGLADSRLENLERLRRLLGFSCPVPFMLIRTPLVAEAERVVALADFSLQVDVEVVKALARAAARQGRRHRVLLMLDMGDGREGVDPRRAREIVARMAEAAEGSPVEVAGMATNFACFRGAIPTRSVLQDLIQIVHEAGRQLGWKQPIVSGGNSSLVPYLFDGSLPRGVSQIRVGEALLLGTIPPASVPHPALRQDTAVLRAPLIEVKTWLASAGMGAGAGLGAGAGAEAPTHNLFGRVKPLSPGIHRLGVVAMGHQDTQVDDLRPLDPGVRIIGASSDHLVVEFSEETPAAIEAGTVLSFRPGYAALLQAATSPYVRVRKKADLRQTRNHARGRAAVDRLRVALVFAAQEGSCGGASLGGATVDPTSRAIAAALSEEQSRRYEVLPVPLDPLNAGQMLLEFAPDVIFNNFRGSKQFTQAQGAAWLEAVSAEIAARLGKPIPIVGSSAHTHFLALNKFTAKQIMQAHGLPVPRGFLVFSTRPAPVLPPDLDYPLIVKPVAEGSSRGIDEQSVVHSAGELQAQLHRLLSEFGPPALVEQYVSGREFTVGVMGNPPRALPVVEIAFARGARGQGHAPVSWYSHAIKAGDAVPTLCPAPISAELARRLADLAVGAFKALGCLDFARVDIRVDEGGRPYVLELNSLPGLRPGYSDFPKAAAVAGFSFADLIDYLIELALARSQPLARAVGHPDA